MDEADENWLSVCDVTDIDEGEAKRVELDPPLAVFNVDGEFLAIDDTCTHAESSLADGYIDGDRVECAFHFAKFSIRTGEALTLPAYEPVCSYPVRVVDGKVLVRHRQS